MLYLFRQFFKEGWSGTKIDRACYLAGLNPERSVCSSGSLAEDLTSFYSPCTDIMVIMCPQTRRLMFIKIIPVNTNPTEKSEKSKEAVLFSNYFRDIFHDWSDNNRTKSSNRRKRL